MKKTTTDMDNYMTIKEAVHALSDKIGRSKLYEMLKNGDIPKYKFGGRTFLDKNDVSNLKPQRA